MRNYWLDRTSRLHSQILKAESARAEAARLFDAFRRLMAEAGINPQHCEGSLDEPYVYYAAWNLLKTEYEKNKAYYDFIQVDQRAVRSYLTETFLN